MKDKIGDRIKSFYEDRTRIYLPRRTYTIIRIDGKSFHSYTKGLQRPFDDTLITDMNLTAQFLCSQIQGAKFAFVQSDEISILLTDFDKLTTDAWFDGNIQKMVSVSASLATGKFNELRFSITNKLAFFDSRVFTIPYQTEVENYFIWRQQDATRNSISSVAQSLYSHKELNGKDCAELQEMIFKKGINWNDYKPVYKRGRGIIKQAEEIITGTIKTIRNKWVVTDVPIFTQDKEYFNKLLPEIS
jgi:tRNA(His) guanylyltransferase